MSDTPRTDILLVVYDLDPKPDTIINHARQLERELHAANSIIRQQQLLDEENLRLQDRIKRLEEDLMDAKNKHAALVADVALYEDRGERIKRLEECTQIAWGIIANVDSGSWGEQRSDWREAAIRWRDEQFHPAFRLSEHQSKEAKL